MSGSTKIGESRFAAGDLVVCREHPSSPMIVTFVLGNRVFVVNGARPSYNQRELHGTGIKMVGPRVVRR